MQTIYGTNGELTFNFANVTAEHVLQNLMNANIAECEKFTEILLHTNQDTAALILDPSLRYMSDLMSGLCDPSKGHPIPEEDIVKTDREHVVRSSKSYLMNNSPRGYCVLLNNYYTFGTYKEMQRFRNIFFQLHFNVIMLKNLSANEIICELSKLIVSEQIKSHDAFVFLSISHGNADHEILGFDKTRIKIDGLTSMFNNKNCPSLAKKPKLFIFNCCRGGLYFYFHFQ